MLPKERQLYERQVGKFVLRLKDLFYDQEVELKAEYCNFGRQSPPFDARKDGVYQAIKVGDRWGSDWDQAWFHLTGTIPNEWRGRKVVGRLHLGGEGCIFDKDGTPIQAISCHTIWQSKFQRDRHVLSEAASGGETIDLWIDATAAQLFGLQLQADPRPEDIKRYGHYEATVADLAVATFRDDIWQLYLDASVLENLMLSLEEGSVRRERLLYALRDAADLFDESTASAGAARDRLRFELQKPAEASALRATAVGHAHIDSAWLWPLRETIKKCARTFSAQLALIEKYPGYVFGASQAQHYQFVKEHYPSLYRKIKREIERKAWEVQGGMWVEADCNLISGESMVRQFIHGMNFFKDEFQVDVRNLWLPDVFGYSAALPQILRKCGIDAMVTQKISWNQFNKFPHHSFVWAGIDGSEVSVHFPPEDTYNSELKPGSMRKAQANFSEKGFLDEFLVLHGIGDGGGGPTEEIIECGLRQQNLEGTPKLRFEAAQAMLDRLLKERRKLPRWTGELYLELHRGTLTTQAANKKMNRSLELRLRELEILYSAASDRPYPQADLDWMWKKLLLNQFHDIIPGSSIHIVYKDSQEDYREITAKADGLRSKLGAASGADSLTLVNTLSYAYSRPLSLPQSWANCEILDDQGSSLPTQHGVDGRTVVLAEVPGLSNRTIHRGKVFASSGQAPSRQGSLEGYRLENDLVRYEFAADGTIRRAFDKECKREIIPSGKAANLLRLYEDRPNNWDAWDVDIFYENQLREQAKLLTWRLIADGPLLQVLHLDFAVGVSKLSQRVSLAGNSKRLEFSCSVDWRERHKMLRVGFFVDVFTDQAHYEIQYGMIKRPNHRNTSWDLARFEVVGHRFADLSDHQYGVALLNDCKYGHKILENYMELNLLRAPVMPDPEADHGSHEFTYALLPHKNSILASDVFSEAQQLNQALSLFEGSMFPAFPCRLDSEDVVLEVLKKAEKEDALIIRLYEPKGLSVQARLNLARNFKKAYATDLLERTQEELPIDGGSISLEFKAFEIKTLKLFAR